MAKACFWVGTLNNYTPGEEDYPSWLKEHCDYAIIGKEVGESGTPHLQCVFKFKDRIRITGIKKLDPVATWSRFHMEPMKGQLHQAIDYCKKEGSWVEIGDRPIPPCEKGGAGNKRAWDEDLTAIQEGRFEDVRPQVQVQYFKNMRLMHAEHLFSGRNKETLNDVDLPNEWYHGPTGTGKSKKARSDNPDAFLKASDGKWWDGYRGEDCVILEEWELKHSKEQGHYLKLWADRYPFSAEIKGGFLGSIRPKKLIITSNYSIDECFAHDDRLAAAVKRRFTEVYFSEQLS